MALGNLKITVTLETLVFRLLISTVVKKFLTGTLKVVKSAISYRTLETGYYESVSSSSRLILLLLGCNWLGL